MMHTVVNGQRLEIAAEHANTPALEWLRGTAQVKSVKQGCGEGGCGACAVFVKKEDPTGKVSLQSLNSCLLPVYALDGAEVWTAEHLPTNADGQQPIAERLAGFHGSQCGFCTPGMAVACHTALAQAAADGRPAPSCQELRRALEGNLCRCTGYRPIVSACMSFAADADIEDLGVNVFKSTNKPLPAAPDLTSTLAPPACEPVLAPVNVTMSGGQTLVQPRTLPQLVVALEKNRGKNVRIVAGNTAYGVYKEWPTQDVLIHISKIAELHKLQAVPTKRVDSSTGEVLHIGAAVSLATVIDQLTKWTKEGADGDTVHGVAACHTVWREVHQHLQRVANHHVRSQATLVGNLVLARRRGLPSDIATLMLALGAHVEVMSELDYQKLSVLPLDSFLREEEGTGRVKLDEPATVITAALVPVPKAGSRFWSHRIAKRWSNAVSVINAAALRPADSRSSAPTFVLGMNLRGSEGPERWIVKHCPAVEACMANADLTTEGFRAASLSLLSALSQDLAAQFTLNSPDVPADHAAFLRSTAEGLLLQCLAALYFDTATEAEQESRDSIPAEPPARYMRAQGGREPLTAKGERGRPLALPVKFAEPEVPGGTQLLQSPDAALAPMTQALPKESAVNQALGLARYADDLPEQKGALYAAWVTSPVAKGTVRHVDTRACGQVPGYVRFIGPDQVPGAIPGFIFESEPVFAKEVGYHGQAVGIVLATSQQAALRAASLAVVEVDPPETPAVVTAAQALACNAVYDLPRVLPMYAPGEAPGSVRLGHAADEVAACIQAAPLRLQKQHIQTPSQAHMYIEPQTAIAEVDEDGCVRVHASAQNTDIVLGTLSHVLKRPHNKIEVVCRRVGGGFGGKLMAPERVASAAAVAAITTKRQVRLVTNRNVDMAMFGGRSQADVTYDIGYDSDGRILALDLRYTLTGGAYASLAWEDLGRLLSVVDNVYDIQSFRVEFVLLKCNLPPRTVVRAPGDFVGMLVIESIMERVAAALCLDPLTVRERNMRQATPGVNLQNSLGKPICAPEQYTLPRMLKELKEKVNWPARRDAVAAFNASSLWRKRGLSLVPCMYPLWCGMRSAMVQVYADGSVRVAHSGVEIGQGLSIKVLQTAAYELSQILPESQRPLSLDLFRTADVSSYTLPHNSSTFGSTTSESACAAVRKACQELVKRLKPLAATLGDSYTWKQIIAKASPWPGMRGPVDLQVVAEASLTADLSHPPYTIRHTMTTHGVAVAEVEVDVLTGERNVSSVDILFDCGRSLNPAVDLGQIEGAFVFGMGMLMSEHVKADPDTGACTTASTWNYKIPTATCVPQRMNVTMLEDSPLAFKGTIGAKAVGEPPLLLSCSVLFALEAAARAAASQVFKEPTDTLRLTIPAEPKAVKRACGTTSLSAVLAKLDM